jgi:hypothetical protein
MEVNLTLLVVLLTTVIVLPGKYLVAICLYLAKSISTHYKPTNSQLAIPKKESEENKTCACCAVLFLTYISQVHYEEFPFFSPSHTVQYVLL